MTTTRSTPSPRSASGFAVTIDDIQLSTFQQLQRAWVSRVVLEQQEEGSNNGFVWQLPTRLKFTNIKLTRAVCSDTTG